MQQTFLTPIHVPVKLHITWGWAHFLSNWMLICFMLKLSHCKECCVYTFNIVSVVPCFISIDWLATPLWGMLWVPESPHSRWILPVCAKHCTLKKSIAGTVIVELYMDLWMLSFVSVYACGLTYPLFLWHIWLQLDLRTRLELVKRADKFSRQKMKPTSVPSGYG